MRRPINFRQLCAALLCAACLNSLRAEETTAPRVDAEKWIELLEKGDFDQRKDAAKKLEALGDKARSSLEKALKESDSPEIRDSVERLLAGLMRSRLVIEALDTHGKPMAGAEATLVVTQQNVAPVAGPEEEIKPIQIKTDEKGRYVYDGASPGGAYVNLQWLHYQAQFLDGIWINALSLQPGENRLRVILQRGGTVTGKVLAADGDAPLEANVQLIADTGTDLRNLDLDDPDQVVEAANDPLRATTTATGEFTLEHVPEGRYALVVRHGDYVTAVGGTVRVEEGKSAPTETVKLVSKTKAYGGIKMKFIDAKGELLKSTTLHGTIQRMPAAAENDERLQSHQMRLMRQGMLQPEIQDVPVDENGDAEIKNLAPGAYWMLVRQEQKEELHQVTSIVVEAGKTTTVPDLKPAKTGNASGVVVGAAGHEGLVRIVALNWADPVGLLILRNLKLYESFLNNDDERDGTNAQTDELGKFELKNMVPGRYSFCIVKSATVIGVVHGVDIVSEKTTAIPDFKLTGADAVKPSVHGVVLLPNGKPAENASVTITNNKSGSSVGFNTGEDGTFTSNGNLTGANAQVIVTCPSYRPYHLNLAMPGLDLGNLRIVLEKQIFGSVAITVRDGDGHPLKGAQVSVRQGPNLPFAYPTGNRMHVTEKSGRAVVKGIPIGKRELQAALDGYYLEKPLPITVTSETEATAELVMKRGFKVSGSVEVPAGVDPASVVVCMQRTTDNNQYGYEFWHTAIVDTKGHFEFNGVEPGKVRVHGLCPGLLTKHAGATFDAEIGATPVELKCTMLRAGFAQFDMGEKGRGRTASLVEPGSWKASGSTSKLSELLSQRQINYINTQADSLGQIQVGAQLPGRYDIMISPFTEDDNDDETISTSHRAEASLIFPGIEIAPAPTAATIPALKLTPPDSSASAAGTIRLNVDSPWQPDEQTIGNLALTIVGERAIGSIDFSLPEAVDPAQVLQIIGTPPPGFHLESPGEFTLSGLPPGEYQVFADFENYEGEGWSWNLKPSAAPATERKPLKHFTVAKGEKAQLGELTIELPAAIRTKMREQHSKQLAAQAEQNFSNAANEDDAANFQP